MQIIAKLVQVLPLVEGEGKNGPWKKQEIIIETEGQIPRKIAVSIWGDKIPGTLTVGQSLNLSFDIESREYNSRWYTEVKAWKVEVVGGIQNMSDAKMPSDVPPVESDGLPF